jgi:hypothetical protein
MDKVSLQNFQRDFLLTHLKNKPECVLDCLAQMCQSNLSSVSFGDLLMRVIEACWRDQTAFRCNSWYTCEISLNKCYFAHTDFRGFNLPKDQRIVDFLDAHIDKIELGLFPMSREIRSEWQPMPRVIVEERGPDDWTRRVTVTTTAWNNSGHERYYVLDGQLRVIRYWYHQKPWVPVYIYRGNGSV